MLLGEVVFAKCGGESPFSGRRVFPVLIQASSLGSHRARCPYLEGQAHSHSPAEPPEVFHEQGDTELIHW